MLDNYSPDAIARRLEIAIDDAKASNTSLADAVGVSVQAVGFWLRTGKIGRARIPKIASALSVSAHWLLTGQGAMRGPHALDAARDAAPSAAIAPDLEALLLRATPRSQADLRRIAEAAAAGKLGDEDLRLLRAIAERFAGEK